MAKNKHLILDVSVIIDLWLGSGSAEATEALMDLAIENKARLWIAASSIPILDYVMRRALKRKGASPEEAGEIVPALMRDLMSVAGVLTNFGFDQQAIYQAARDAEDAQIAAAGRNFNGVPVCVVSEDACFDTLDEIPVKTPAEALTWLYRETADNPAPMSFIDLATQQAELRSGIEQGIARVLHHGRYIMGPEVKQLEEKLAAYTEVPHCITCASGTDALLMALMALDIGPGDEVITAANTFVATTFAISYTGARPVLVDVDPYTYTLDIIQLQEAITPRTRAIMPVHLFGQPADMEPILTLAHQHNLIVIEDACQAHGARYKGRRAGSMGHAAAFSFYPAKNLGAFGDGGMVVTNDATIAEAVSKLRNYGQSEKYHHDLLGYNRRLDTLQAAVLRIKLKHLDEWNAARSAHARLYQQLLGGNGIRLPVEANYSEAVWHLYVIRTTARDELQAYLKERHIGTGIHYPVPVHLQPAHRDLGYSVGDFPVTEHSAGELLSLPMYAELTPALVAYVADTIKAFLADHVRLHAVG